MQWQRLVQRAIRSVPAVPVAAVAGSAALAFCQGVAESDDVPLAPPQPARRLYLFDAVTDKSANALVKELHDLERQAPGAPIELYVNSDGGDLVAGLAVVDTMRQLSAPIHTVCIGRCRSVAAAVLAAGAPGHRGVSVSARVSILEPPCDGSSTVPIISKGNAHTLACEMLATKAAACLRQRQIWDSALASLSGQSREDWNETLQKLSAHGPQGVLGFGEDFDADVAVAMRLADFVLEGPAAIGLKRTDPEGVPQRMYTSDPTEYESASGAEEHEEAADAAASTHST
jgi:ATP-dependent Clp protease protease subunit